MVSVRIDSKTVILVKASKVTPDYAERYRAKMRDAQKSWFQCHNRADLDRSKKLERQVDAAIEEYLNPNPQMDLFG